MEPMLVMRTAVVLLVLTALGGLAMAAIRFAGKPHPPSWMAMGHGFIAGAAVTLSAAREDAMEADGLVVPGVGAFAACMRGLLGVRGSEIIGRRLAGGRPVLGICVGMQILFEKGVEHSVQT